MKPRKVGRSTRKVETKKTEGNSEEWLKGTYYNQVRLSAIHFLGIAASSWVMAWHREHGLTTCLTLGKQSVCSYWRLPDPHFWPNLAVLFGRWRLRPLFLAPLPCARVLGLLAKINSVSRHDQECL